jgi:NSS family neurotransmitter:Na+ symporter
MIVTAMGQAFFTLSLGMCAIMTYGAYLPAGVSIPRVGITVAAADTAVALIAGLAIFPIVISYGIDPAGGGAGLIFTSLPLAFNEMPFGILYGMMFFLLLSVAAWTSSISLLEPATAYLVERTNLGRKAAAMIVGALAWLAGMASVFSFNVWSHVSIGGRDIMSAIEHAANNIMMPLGGMLIAVFAGWVLSNQVTHEELDKKMPDWAFNAWLWLVRVVTPALILVVLASLMGLI